MDFFSTIAGSRYPAIDSVIVSVDRGKSLIRCLLRYKNEEVRAQEIIDSAGKYTLNFYY
jgi:hypothetical protein